MGDAPAIVSEPVDSLVLHEANPRQGDVGAVVESIRTNGWYGVITAQTGTRRVLAGNHRLIAARQLGIETVPVHWLDVDDEAALRILLADNRTSDRASYDDASLIELLSELAGGTGLGLDGTGYDSEDLDTLIADLTTPFPVAMAAAGLAPERLEGHQEHRCPSCGNQWSGSCTPEP